MPFSNLFREIEGLAGAYTTGRTLMTVNSVRDAVVYGERLVEFRGVQYRAWDPYRSKLAAMILLGARDVFPSRASKVLYLGAASGTTASHVSDIVVDGTVFCVEVSQRPFRDLVKVCEARKNMIPIMADASRPQDYTHLVERADVVYQDIAQRDQADIFARNMLHFEAAWGILLAKSRSVDVNMEPKAVYARVRAGLVAKGLHVVQVFDLDEYAKDHAAFVVRR